MIKNRMLIFADYLLVWGLSILSIFALSSYYDYSWSNLVFGIAFVCLFASLLYSRGWKRAKDQYLPIEKDPTMSEAFSLVLPFIVFNLVIILAYLIIYYNIIPVKDNVVGVSYTFLLNEPRIRAEFTVMDLASLISRAVYLPFATLMREAKTTSVAVMLISPACALIFYPLGYFFGMKKVMISEHVAKVMKKAKDNFNK